ncbi:FG-GAP-like repeat-containing protein [Streptomyces sp. NPDC007863]|uniref:FG-GAP-like repeat-containing protein n=1 Tax=Streptomyces sp. NPDC007863 TaxID=3154894 RepID=UPI0034012E03
MPRTTPGPTRTRAVAAAIVLGLVTAGLAASPATAAETVYPTFSSAFNNAGIATQASPGLANLDGEGDSLSADALDAAGWTRGARVTVNGTTYTRPDVAPGQLDNIVAGGQRVPVSGAGNALGFLLTATGGAVSGSGTVHYDDGTTSSYSLSGIGDWESGNTVAAAVVLGRSARETAPVKLFAVTVPITTGKTVASVTLPTAPADGKRLHVFSMAVRGTPAAPGGAAWTGSWAASFSHAASTAQGSDPDWSNQTIRMVVNPHTSGSTIRLRFANTFSAEPVKLGRVTVTGQSGGATATQTPVTLTFGGSQQATLPAGGELVSDPVSLPVTAGKNLLVSYYLPGTVKAAPRHPYARQTSYSTARLAGDQTTDVSGADYTRELSYWSLVSGVDVARTGSQGTVVAIGDSQTDAGHSTPNTNRRWPDFFASFLNSRSSSAPGVLNAGISANWLTTDSTGGGGPSAVTRLDRDVFAQPNIREVVLYEGVNDIVSGVSATTVTNAIRSIASQARARGIRVTVATIPGFSGYPSANASFRLREAVRQTVNNYIRTTSDIDDYIDFDAVTRDLDDPYAIRPDIASDTDDFHFNDAGTELLGRTLADREVRASLPMGETTAADFNGDSVSDLLARHDPTGTLKIWFGRGDGTFTSAKDLTGGWQNYSQTVAGDFTGDGKADIMARYEGPADANVPQNTLRLWVNRGDGTFGAASNVTGGWNFTQTAAADFDGNGKDDLIARDANGNLKIWAGRGDGTFGAAAQLTAGWNFAQTVAADFNEDGEADIIARDPATNTLKMWTHNAGGYFNSAVTVTGGWNFSQTTAAADIDGDGKGDILARDDATGTLKAWSGRGDGTFGMARSLTGGW